MRSSHFDVSVGICSVESACESAALAYAVADRDCDGSADGTTTSSPGQLASPIRHAASVGEKACRDHRVMACAYEKGVE
jgi:hypothetical protein